MEQEEAQNLAVEILRLRLQAKTTELSAAIKRSRMVYRCIRRIAAKRVKNHFIRRILKLVDGFLRWAFKGMQKKIKNLKKEQQEIRKALEDLAAGQLNSAIELLEENLRLSWLANFDDAVITSSFHDAWLVDLISALKGEGG